VVSDKLVAELGVILDQEFGLKLESPTLNRLANFLITYFQLVLQINNPK
jgi:hypothetical protein